jgi:hypothetical protein
MGVNVTETMKQADIELEWPPMKYSYQIALAGTKKDDVIKSFEKFVINEGIKWYDKGKFSEEEKIEVNDIEIFEVGDRVSLSCGCWWNDRVFDSEKTSVNNPGDWHASSDYYNNIITVTKTDYCTNIKGYTGQVVQLSGKWPWFQTTNLKREIYEGIKWYDKGKFSEEEPSTIEEKRFEIGDYVKKTGKNYFFDKMDWNSTENVRDGYIRIVDIRNINTEEYKGQLIKFKQYWPWFQTTNFESSFTFIAKNLNLQRLEEK